MHSYPQGCHGFFVNGDMEMKLGIAKLLSDEGHSMSEVFRLIKLSSSHFYSWVKNGFKRARRDDSSLVGKIKEIFKNSKKIYGSPRVAKQLQKEGIKSSENKVAKIMRSEGLVALKKKRFTPKTTINNPSDRKSARVFKIEDYRQEDKVWASDLTYIPIANKFVYLVVLMDLFNREIIGWDVSASMEAEHIKDALINAMRTTDEDLSRVVFHSDLGVQSWINQYRRLKIRWEKNSENYEALCHFTFAMIAFRQAEVFG